MKRIVLLALALLAPLAMGCTPADAAPPRPVLSSAGGWEPDALLAVRDYRRGYGYGTGRGHRGSYSYARPHHGYRSGYGYRNRGYGYATPRYGYRSGYGYENRAYYRSPSRYYGYRRY